MEIHDVDFILHCFGLPKSVHSFGYSKTTNHIDHVLTRYVYDDVPLVVAEGGWEMAKGFGFSMRYTVNFELATADFDLAREKKLVLFRPNHETEFVALPPGSGYDHQIAYFLGCIAEGRSPELVTLEDAADAIMGWYKTSKEERDKVGLLGRDYCLLEETGISAVNMGKRFIKDMNKAFDEWEPISRYTLYEV